MDIRPNLGIGKIEFGMSPSEVKDIMGTDLIYQDWMGGNLNDCLFYSDIVVGFNNCDENEPLPNSQVVEFRCNNSGRVLFDGNALSILTRDKLKEMVYLGVAGQLDRNLDLSFQDLGISFGFNEDGSVCILEMWQHKNS